MIKRTLYFIRSAVALNSSVVTITASSTHGLVITGTLPCNKDKNTRNYKSQYNHIIHCGHPSRSLYIL